MPGGRILKRMGEGEDSQRRAEWRGARVGGNVHVPSFGLPMRGAAPYLRPLISSGERSFARRKGLSLLAEWHARVAELADALDSGSSPLTRVQVQVLSRAPSRDKGDGHIWTHSSVEHTSTEQQDVRHSS